MERREVTPSELDFESKGRRDYWVVLSTSTGTFYRIPLTVLVGPGAQEGKGLVAFGGNHGDESEGPLAIKNILGELDSVEVLGRMIMVPVLNVAAFSVGTRESTADDGLNLNRMFDPLDSLQGPRDTITHRIAAFVRECIWPYVHIVIDVHSGGDVMRTALEVSYTPSEDIVNNAEREQIARWSGAPFVIRRKGAPDDKSGLLIDDAARQGKMSFGSELGWGGTSDPDGVRYARHCVIAAAFHHGQINASIEPIDYHADGTQRLISGGAVMTAPYDGHFESFVMCGESVRRGQTVGHMHDFEQIDKPVLPIVSDADGFAMSRSRSARVCSNQVLVGVGYEVGI